MLDVVDVVDMADMVDMVGPVTFFCQRFLNDETN